MTIETVIVMMIIAASACYLASHFLKSLRPKGKGHCSGCGKD